MIVLLQITSGAFLGWLLRASFEASLVAVLVVLAQFALRKRVSARWRYNLWLLVLARLALPVFPESRLSPFNWLKLHHDPASTSSWVIQNHDTNPLPGDVIKPQTKASSPTTDRTARLVEMAEPPSVNVKERLNQIEFQEAQQAPNQMAMPRHAAPSRSVHRTSAASGIAEVQPRLGVTKFWVRINWKFYLWTIWCAGASLFALWAIITTLRLAWMSRGYRRIDDPALYAILAGCCRQVGVRRVPVVLESPGHLGPSLVGYFRPRLMVPRSALEMLKPNELRLVLLHELVHLKRGDVAW